MLRPRVRRVFRLAIRRPARAAAEMDDEIHLHLELRAAQLVERGWAPDAAMAEARRLFGPPEMRHSLHAAARRREEILSMADRLDALRHDLGYAVRQIRRAPGVAIAVTLTFALGIGANATMFGIIDRLLLRPPPHIAAPGDVYRFEVKWRVGSGEEYTNTAFSYPAYLDFRDRLQAFASVAVHTFPNPISLGTGEHARRIDGVMISGSYFATLGTTMAVGRPIGADDDRMPNGSPVAVIGYGLWQSEFGGEPTVLGKEISLAGRRYSIIGVAPAGFNGTSSRRIDVWIPVTAADGLRFVGKNWATDRTSSWMSVVGRLRAGVSAPTAEAQITAVYRAGEATAKRTDSTSRGQLTSVLPIRQRKLGPASRVAALLAIVSLLVLAIACANVANLLLVRAFARRREVAVRLALGISRGRLVRQLVLEAVLLALVGGLAALAVVHWGTAILQNVLLSDYAWRESRLDGRVLAFVALATVVVGAMTGVIPALQGSDPSLARTLREGTRGSGLARSRTRSVLLLLQAAVSVVLLVGTGLFVRSLRNVREVNFGIDVNRLVSATTDLRAVGFDSAASQRYFVAAQEQVARIPGIASVALADAAPFGDWSIGIDLHLPGRDSLPKTSEYPNQSWVTPNYFRTVGTRILRGRAFTDADALTNAPRVAIVSESVERWLWPGASAVGQCVVIGEKTDPCVEIVGVSENTHRGSIVQDADPLQIYSPLTPGGGSTRARNLIARPVSGDPRDFVEPVRRVMQSAVPGVPYAGVRAMRSVLDDELRPWELGATVFAAFGAIALLLSTLGLYSVVAYTVAQRMHEMGVRRALGAQAADLRRLVLAQGLRVATVGIAIGTIIALAAGRFVAPMLFRTSPRDPIVLTTTISVLLVTALMASLAPARRAERADPLDALRSE